MNTFELDRALEEFCKIDHTVQAITMRVLLFIAEKGTTGQKSIEKELKITNASASRNVAYWTSLRSDKREGPGFVQQIEDRDDRRTRILTLTKKGQAFVEKMRKI